MARFGKAVLGDIEPGALMEHKIPFDPTEMLRLKRPSDEAIRALIERQSALPFSYAEVGASGVRFAVDDLHVRLATFWEFDNLVNLDFEEPMLRGTGYYPQRFNAPSSWLLDAVPCRRTTVSSPAHPRGSCRRPFRRS